MDFRDIISYYFELLILKIHLNFVWNIRCNPGHAFICKFWSTSVGKFRLVGEKGNKFTTKWQRYFKGSNAKLLKLDSSFSSVLSVSSRLFSFFLHENLTSEIQQNEDRWRMSWSWRGVFFLSPLVMACERMNLILLPLTTFMLWGNIKKIHVRFSTHFPPSFCLILPYSQEFSLQCQAHFPG